MKKKRAFLLGVKEKRPGVSWFPRDKGSSQNILLTRCPPSPAAKLHAFQSISSKIIHLSPAPPTLHPTLGCIHLHFSGLCWIFIALFLISPASCHLSCIINSAHFKLNKYITIASYIRSLQYFKQKLGKLWSFFKNMWLPLIQWIHCYSLFPSSKLLYCNKMLRHKLILINFFKLSLKLGKTLQVKK